MTDIKLYPIIGAKYRGPNYDRPALRTLPFGWELETEQRDPDGMVGNWCMAIGIVCVLWAVVLFVAKAAGAL